MQINNPMMESTKNLRSLCSLGSTVGGIKLQPPPLPPTYPPHHLQCALYHSPCMSLPLLFYSHSSFFFLRTNLVNGEKRRFSSATHVDCSVYADSLPPPLHAFPSSASSFCVNGILISTVASSRIRGIVVGNWNLVESVNWLTRCLSSVPSHSSSPATKCF